MAYFNNANANFYSTFAPEEFDTDTYPFLNQMSTNEGVNYQGPSTFAYGWNTPRQPGPMIGLATSQWATASHKPAAPASSYVNGYSWPTYSNQYWPEIDQQAESYHSGSLSREFSPAMTAEAGPSTTVPTPSIVPFDYWGENQSGPSTSTFCEQNVRPSYQPSASLTGTELTSTGQFHPYGGISCARPNEHRNAEAGPSILPIPYGGLLMPHPSGGLSETTAYAEQKQTNTEEEGVPRQTSKRTRGQGPPRPYRVQMKGDTGRLCTWVQRWKGLHHTPSINDALAVAADLVPVIRKLENLEPRLRTGQAKRTAAGRRHADDEVRRRDVERSLFQELSRYYPLPQSQNVWTRTSLLPLVVESLERWRPLLEPSDGPLP